MYTDNFFTANDKYVLSIRQLKRVIAFLSVYDTDLYTKNAI